METWLVIICIVWYSSEMAPQSIVIDTEFLPWKLRHRDITETFLW